MNANNTKFPKNWTEVYTSADKELAYKKNNNYYYTYSIDWITNQ